MADKKVTVQVDVDADDSKVKAIDAELQRLKMQRLQLNIDANKEKLAEIESQIEGIDAVIETSVDLSDEELDELSAEMAQLQNQKVNLQIAVADDELTQARAEEEALNTTANVDIAVDDSAVQGAMQNINDGINQAKQGFGELAQAAGQTLEVSGMAEQNKAFLEMNLGAEKAAQSLDMINQTAAKMPGDDNTMRSILSSAQALGSNLSASEMEQATAAMADYMAGSQKMGKMALETQQDLTKYLLDGNTAELERGSILSAYVDKLKDGNTFQERAVLLEQALKDAKYQGISQQDTLLNKQQKYEGALYNAQLAIGDMFNMGMSGVMDFMVGLDGATGGLSSIAAVLVTQFGPGLFTATQGIVTMIPGISQMIAAMGGLGGIIPTITGALSGAGSALMAFATGPIGIAIAAIALLAIGIYEAGKAFGWWTDVGSMLDAMKAGVMSLWEAFTSNPYVIQAIDLIRQGLTDAWNAIVGFGQAIMTAFSGAGGQFDILSFMISNLNMVLNAVGPLIVLAIQGIITHFRLIYTVAQIVWPYVASAVSSAINIAMGIVNAGKSVFNSLVGVWNTLKSAVQNMASTISSALSSAGSAWNAFKSTVMSAVQPILDAANQVGDAMANIGGLIGFGGIETPTVSTGGYTGANTSISQGNTIIFNMYGDIRDEQTLDETIDAINNRIQFEAIANGTLETNTGGGI